MERLLYVDTCVYVNVANEEGTDDLPLAVIAEEFLHRGISCKFKVVYSDLTWKELSPQLREERLGALIHWLKNRNKLFKVEPTQEDLDAQLAYKGANPKDHMHALLARRAGALCVVTRDRHFDEFSHIISWKLPERC